MTPGRIRSLILSIITVCLFISCPTPFDKDKLLTLQDLNPPVITISTPTQGSLFESSLTVTGTIIDIDSEGDSRGTEEADQYIGSAAFIIKNQESDSTAITVGTDGSFSFSVPTAEYDKQITIQITAVDINDNEAESTVIVDPDTDGPNLVLTSPADYSEYATAVILSGYVTNSMETESFSEVNPAITYALPGTDISGELTLSEENGTFSTVLDVSELDGTRTIEVNAQDLNGNETTLVCTITKPAEGGDISGFTVVPGNEQMTISWDDVLFAEFYTLYETNYGMTQENVTSPYVWDGLENGEIYSFTLTANIPSDSGGNANSSSISKMALSPLTLTPQICATDYESLTLEWQDLPQASSYTVERSTSVSGPWEVRRNLSASTFTDDRVEFDTNYHYRITPVECTEIPSYTTSYKPGRFGRHQISHKTFSSTPKDIAVSGDYAYICLDEDGLNIIDISNPEQPGNPVNIMDGETCNDIEFSGDYAFIATGTTGASGYGKLAIVNIANPSNPENPVYVDISSAALSVTVSGEYAYIGTAESGLAIIDISNKLYPGTPSYKSYGIVNCIASYGNYLFIGETELAWNGAGFDVEIFYRILDITGNPTNPVIKSEITLSTMLSDSIYSIDIQGNTTYLAGVFNGVGGSTKGLALIDINDINDPVITGSPVYTDIAYGSKYLSVSGTYAYLDSNEKFQIVDLSDSSSPKYIETITTDSRVSGIAISGNYAYIADKNGGISIVDISNPSNPGTPTYIATTGSFEKIEMYGDTVIVLDTVNGLAGIDVSDSQNPGTPDYFYSAGNVQDFVIAGHYAYLNLYHEGTRILDISNLEAPQELALFDFYSRNYTVFGSYLYMANLSEGLTIYDISDPENPGDPISLSVGFSAEYVSISGNYAFVSGNSSGTIKFASVDISDPDSPVLQNDTATTSSSTNGLTISGNYAYLSLSGYQYAVIDISTPTTPGTPQYFDLSNTPYAAEISGSYAFFPVRADGIGIVDTLDHESPGKPVYADTTGTAYDITVSGSYAYVADGTAGLAIISLLGDE